MSGSRKLSIAQSSCRLFCSGVPVTRRRKWVVKRRTTFESTDPSFLMRCASSMIRYRQTSFESAAFSEIATSYVVMHTSKRGLASSDGAKWRRFVVARGASAHS